LRKKKSIRNIGARIKISSVLRCWRKTHSFRGVASVDSDDMRNVSEYVREKGGRKRRSLPWVRTA
jgi:hypothetical protein